MFRVISTLFYECRKIFDVVSIPLGDYNVTAWQLLVGGFCFVCSIRLISSWIGIGAGLSELNDIDSKRGRK